jgi:hypothetical protein
MTVVRKKISQFILIIIQIERKLTFTVLQTLIKKFESNFKIVMFFPVKSI